MTRQDPANMNDIDLKEWVMNTDEKYFIEFKRGTELPKAFWETYSAFSNTEGGWIILGVTEGHPQNKITGVTNVEKTLGDLWNQLSNPNKVSYKTVNNQDILQCIIDDKSVIIIRVHEAPEKRKPVYTEGKVDNAWIRTGDGDRRVTKDELAIFMRNAQPGEDSLAVDKYTIDDLDSISLITFKERVSKRYPKKNYLEMSHEDFLIEIGACFNDRNTGEFKVRRGTLLFLGKVNSIKEVFNHYHLDFFNRRGESRWIDRVSDDEPSDYEMNLYNFYMIVYEKMKMLLQESFNLDSGQLRIPLSSFDETIRECLVNCLAHADYLQGYPSTKIEVYDGWFCFNNPGKMLISPKQFLVGGDSRPRNETIMKMFRLLGASERQGFGGPLIYKTAVENDFRRPEIVSDLEHTEIKVWNIDLADSYPDLSVDEKNILKFITKSGTAQAVNDIKRNYKTSDYKIRKALQSLEERQLLQRVGNGPSTKYINEFSSVERLTQLQMKMDNLRKSYR